MAKKVSLRRLLRSPSDGDGGDRSDVTSSDTNFSDDEDGNTFKNRIDRSDNKNSQKEEKERILLFKTKSKKKKEGKMDHVKENEGESRIGICSEQQNHSQHQEDSTSKPNANVDGGDEESVEDLHQILDEIEILDFNLSLSFDNESENEATNALPRTNDPECIDYEDRLDREEVFSKRYHPSKLEAKELQSLADELGLTTSSFRMTSCQKNVHELLFGNHAMILKRGPLYFNGHDCELVLLTDGFLPVYRNVNVYNPLESRYNTCQLWSMVAFIEIASFGTLKIHMQTREIFELSFTSDGDDLRKWFSAIEKCVVLSAAHSSGSSRTLLDLFGWQYTLVRKPAYTAAVLGDMNLMGNPKNLNKRDEFNQSSPLHYAIQQEPYNIDVIDALLRAGADPNFEDGDGRSAMYLVQRNGLRDIEEMLMSNGGKKSKLVEIELRGELFGGVDQAQRKTERRREIEQMIKGNQAEAMVLKAQSAQSQMSQNMAAMIERGEKINALDDKASVMNREAKEYGSMASQLKEKMRNKKWYQF